MTTPESTEPRTADLSAMGNEELVTRYAKHVRRLAYLEAEGGLRSAFGFTPQHDTMAEISERCNDYGAELLRRRGVMTDNDWRIMRRSTMRMDDVRMLVAWFWERWREDYSAHPPVPGDPPDILVAVKRIEEALANAVETRESGSTE